MLERREHPTFFAVISAAVFTLWLFAFVGLCVFSIFDDDLTFIEAVGTALLLLLFGTMAVIPICALVSFPMWWICKRFYRLNLTVATVSGALTGAIISVFVIFYFPGVYSMPAGATKEGLIILITMTFFGALAGWNGYRVAWNGRRHKKALKA